MDFFQCLGVTWVSGAWCRLTTRARGSLCSGAGHGGDSEEKLLQEAVEQDWQDKRRQLTT